MLLWLRALEKLPPAGLLAAASIAETGRGVSLPWPKTLQNHSPSFHSCIFFSLLIGKQLILWEALPLGDPSTSTVNWLLCSLIKCLVFTFCVAINCYFPRLWTSSKSSRLQPFWHQGPVSWKTIFPCIGKSGGWFGNDSHTLHLLCTLFLLLLRQLHLRLLGIRFWRLGTLKKRKWVEAKALSLCCFPSRWGSSMKSCIGKLWRRLFVPWIRWKMPISLPCPSPSER